MNFKSRGSSAKLKSFFLRKISLVLTIVLIFEPASHAWAADPGTSLYGDDTARPQGSTPADLTRAQSQAQGAADDQNALLEILGQQPATADPALPVPGVVATHTGAPNQFLQPNLTVTVLENGAVRVKWGSLTSTSTLIRVPAEPGQTCSGVCPEVFTATFSGSMTADNGYVASGYTFTLMIQTDPLNADPFELLSFQVDRPNSNGMTLYSENIQYQNNRPVHYEQHMINPNEVDAWMEYDITYVTLNGQALVETMTYSTRQEYLGSMAGQGTVLTRSRHEYAYDGSGRMVRALDVEGYEKGTVRTWFAILSDFGDTASDSSTAFWITDTAEDLSGLRLSDRNVIESKANVKHVNKTGTALNANGYPMLEHTVYFTRDGHGGWKPVMVFEPSAFLRSGGGSQYTLVVGEPDVTSGETDDIWIRGFENVPDGYSFGLGLADDMSEGRLIGVSRIKGFGLYAVGPGGMSTPAINFPEEDLIVIGGKNYRVRLNEETGKIVFTEEAWQPFVAQVSTTTNAGIEQPYVLTAFQNGTVQMQMPWGGGVLTGQWDPRTLSVTFPVYYSNEYRIEFEHLGGAVYQVKKMTMNSIQHDFRWDFENGLMVKAWLTQKAPADGDFAGNNWVPWSTNAYDLTYQMAGGTLKPSTITYRLLIHRQGGVPLEHDYLDNWHKTYLGYDPDGTLISKLHHRTNADVFGDPYYHFATLQEMEPDGSVSIYYGDTLKDYADLIGSIDDAWKVRQDSRYMDRMYPMSMQEDFALNGGGWAYGTPDHWIQYARDAQGVLKPRTVWERSAGANGGSRWTYKIVVGEPDVLGGGESDDRLFNPWKVVGLPDHIAAAGFGAVKEQKPHASWDVYWDVVGYGLAFYAGQGAYLTEPEDWIDFPNETRVTLGGVDYDVTLNEEGAVVLTEAPLPPPAILPPQGTVTLPFGALDADPSLPAGESTVLEIGPQGQVTLVHDGLTLHGVAQLLGPVDVNCSGSACDQRYEVIFKDPWPRAVGEDHSSLKVQFTSIVQEGAGIPAWIDQIESSRWVNSSMTGTVLTKRMDTVVFASNVPSVRSGHAVDADGSRSDWRHRYTYRWISGGYALTGIFRESTEVGPSGTSQDTTVFSGTEHRVYDSSGHVLMVIGSEGTERNGVSDGWAQVQILDANGALTGHYRTLRTNGDILKGLGVSASYAEVLDAAQVWDQYVRSGTGSGEVRILTSLRAGDDFRPWVWASAEGDQYFVVGQPDLYGALTDDVRFLGVEGLPEDAEYWWGLGVGMEQAVGLYFVEQGSEAFERPRIIASVDLVRGNEILLDGTVYRATLHQDGIIRLLPVPGPESVTASVAGGFLDVPSTLSTPDPLNGRSWWLGAVNAQDAWRISTGRGITVAVVDTGVDMGHEDLAGNIWTNAGEIAGNGIDDDGNGYIDDVHGWDFFNNDNDATDDQGHGTHVAGIIGAMAGNGLGIAGIAPEASIMAVKVLSRNGSGTFDQIIAGIRYAADMGAHVINLSLGGAFMYTLEYMREHFAEVFSEYIQRIFDAVDYAIARGSAVVAAAGNSMMNVNRFVPAGIPGAISVGATTSTDGRATFSNFGMTMDLSAPGHEILSLRAAGTSLGSPLDAGYTSASGTSMAAPMVSGAIALLLAQDPTLTMEGINARLKRSAYDLGTEGYDAFFGAGRIDAYAMLSRDYYADGTLRSVRLTDPDTSGFVLYDYDPDGRTVRKAASDGTVFLYEYWGASLQVRSLREVRGGRLVSETGFTVDGRAQRIFSAAQTGSMWSGGDLGQAIDLWLSTDTGSVKDIQGNIGSESVLNARLLSGFRFTEFTDYDVLLEDGSGRSKRRSGSRLSRPFLSFQAR